MSHQKAYVFTTIQKFNQNVNPEEGYTSRNDIIVITDEAHRTQYGNLALNIRGGSYQMLISLVLQELLYLRMMK